MKINFIENPPKNKDIPATPETPDSGNKQPLIDAVEDNKISNVKKLLDAGADVHAKGDNDSGRTALHSASISGHTVIVKLLIDADADVNAKGDNGDTALYWASFMGYMGRIDVVKLLLDAGADVNAQTADGVTALYRASISGHTVIVKLLIDAGADVNLKDNRYSFTALYWANSKGHTEIVNLLKQAGAI